MYHKWIPHSEEAEEVRIQYILHEDLLFLCKVEPSSFSDSWKGNRGAEVREESLGGPAIKHN